MIIKNLSRKATNGSTGQLINYVARYVLDEKKQLKSDNIFLIKHNLYGQTLAEFVRQFEANEANRIHKRSDQISLQHAILSWHRDDSNLITDGMLNDMAEEFIRLRGKNNLYLFSKHEDKSHIHLHGIVSATQLNGYSSRMSRQNFAYLKTALQEYQKERYPELSHSLPRHGLAKEIGISEIKPEEFTRVGKTTQKETLRQIWHTAIRTAQSHEDLLQQFKDLGHLPYYKGDKLQGIAFDGKTKYRLTNLGMPTEKLIEIAKNEVTEAMALAELQSIRSRSEEQEKELHAREFLHELYADTIERELSNYDNHKNNGFYLDEDVDGEALSKPHIA